MLPLSVKKGLAIWLAGWLIGLLFPFPWPEVTAQLPPGPNGTSSTNVPVPVTSTVTPGTGGSPPGAQEFQQPVTFRNEVQGALDPVNARDFVPLEWVNKALTNGVTGSFIGPGPTGGAGLVSAPPASAITGANGSAIGGYPTSNGVWVAWKYITNGVNAGTGGETIASLSTARNWSSASSAELQFLSTASTATVSLNAVNSAVTNTGLSTFTVKTGAAIPTGDIALAVMVQYCNRAAVAFSSGATLITNLGGGVAVSPGTLCTGINGQNANHGIGYWAFQGGIPAGTTLTWAVGGSGYTAFIVALLDVTNTQVYIPVATPTLAGCSGSSTCWDSQAGTTNPLLTGSRLGTPVFSGLTLTALISNGPPTDTVGTLLNNWKVVNATGTGTFTTGGTGIQAQVSQQVACISAAVSAKCPGFFGPAWQTIGSCTLVAGTCSSTFPTAYANAVVCMASGTATALAMKDTSTLTATTITSSSGADAQLVTYLCSGW